MVNFQEIAAGILRTWVNAAVTNGVIRDAFPQRSHKQPSQRAGGGENFLGVTGH